MLAANDRAPLDAAIAAHVKPLVDPTRTSVGVGESYVGEAAFRQGYYRTYLLRARVEMTGDYISDARASFDQAAVGGGKPIVSYNFV